MVSANIARLQMGVHSATFDLAAEALITGRRRMTVEDVVGVVLAAGQSKRMGFNKLITNLAGRPMVHFPVRNLRKAGVTRILAVVGGPNELEVRVALGPEVDFAVQPSPFGTGDAARAALAHIGDSPHVVVLFGDCPFIGSAHIREAISYHRLMKNDLTVGVATLDDAANFGTTVRNAAGDLVDILENRHADVETERAGRAEIFAGLSVWRRETFLDAVGRLPYKTKANSTRESDLPDAVGMLHEMGAQVGSFSVPSDDALGPNVPAQFRLATQRMRLRRLEELMTEGVRISDFDTVSVDVGVDIEPGVKLLENTRITGEGYVRSNSVIGPRATLSNCEIGSAATVGPDSVLDGCHVGSGARIGRGNWSHQVFPANCVAEDRISGKPRFFRDPHYEIAQTAKSAFAILPFKAPYQDLFRNAVVPTLMRLGFECKMASDNAHLSGVMDDIWRDINAAEVVIADVSEPNPNVWYELGLAHTLNKPVLMLFRKDLDDGERLKQLPFDVRHQGALMYEVEKYELIPLIENWFATYLSSG